MNAVNPAAPKPGDSKADGGKVKIPEVKPDSPTLDGAADREVAPTPHEPAADVDIAEAQRRFEDSNTVTLKHPEHGTEVKALKPSSDYTNYVRGYGYQEVK